MRKLTVVILPLLPAPIKSYNFLIVTFSFSQALLYLGRTRTRRIRGSNTPNLSRLPRHSIIAASIVKTISKGRASGFETLVKRQKGGPGKAKKGN